MLRRKLLVLRNRLASRLGRALERWSYWLEDVALTLETCPNCYHRADFCEGRCTTDQALKLRFEPHTK